MEQTKENLIYGYPQEIHDVAENIINNDIYTSASYMVSELSQNDSYIDELIQVSVKDDYETALFDWWNNEADAKDKAELLEYAQISDENCKTIKDLLQGDVQDLCDYERIEPHQVEALEHWLVSDWLAEQLEKQGEMVLRDFLGFNIWGRTCCGQAIILDGTIQRIAEGL